jgi:CheY-like chemotaxis protein
MAKHEAISDFHEPKITSAPEDGNCSPPLILLAEDSVEDVPSMRIAYEKSGLLNPLAVVQGGQAAVDYLRGDGPYADRQLYPFPRLLLLDLNMPRMDSFDVLTWVRRHPELNPVSVVIVSTSDLESDIQKARALGADDYRTKPEGFDPLIALF